jgi:hypothetical protein
MPHWWLEVNSHIPPHKNDLLVWLSLSADVLLLKLLLIQYITNQVAALLLHIPLSKKKHISPLHSNLAISVMSDYVTEQDPIFHINSVFVNDHVLLQV